VRALLLAVLGLLPALPAAPDAEALARFRRAFEGAAPAPAAERAAAAEGLAKVEGRAGPEAACRALDAVLKGAEALAAERTRVREELARLQASFEAAGGTGPKEAIARQGELRAAGEALRERAEGEALVEAALRAVLGTFRDLRALEWLAGSGIRGSPSPAVRAACADALGGSGSADPAVIRSVRGALKDKDPGVREAVLRALARLAAKEAETLRDLAGSLEDGRWTVRLAAARRLAEMAVPAAVDLLVARLPKEDGHVARIVGGLLGGLTGQRFGSDAGSWTRWWAENRVAYHSGAATLVPGGADPAAAPPPAGERASYYGIPIESRRVLFVLDVSGSMTRPGATDPALTLVDEAKREWGRCLRSFGAESAFGVFAFSDTVRKWKPGIVKATAEAKEDARKWVDDLPASGWTNTWAALEEALRASAADPRNSMGDDYGLFADTIFLMTDGAPTDGSGKPADAKGFPEWRRVLEAVRGWNREKRVAIHCIGIGSEINASFLSALAAENGGTFVQVR
jgi:hypothetical protein